MSKEANKIIRFMCKQLSTCRYVYKNVVDGCYEAAIHNYGMDAPVEGKDWIVSKVISILNI